MINSTRQDLPISAGHVGIANYHDTIRIDCIRGTDSCRTMQMVFIAFSIWEHVLMDCALNFTNTASFGFNNIFSTRLKWNDDRRILDITCLMNLCEFEYDYFLRLLYVNITYYK